MDVSDENPVMHDHTFELALACGLACECEFFLAFLQQLEQRLKVCGLRLLSGVSFFVVSCVATGTDYYSVSSPLAVLV